MHVTCHGAWLRGHMVELYSHLTCHGNIACMCELHFPFLLLYTGVGTTLCRADRLVGQVLGAIGALSDIYTELEISHFLLRRLLGVRTEGDKKGSGSKVD